MALVVVLILLALLLGGVGIVWHLAWWLAFIVLVVLAIDLLTGRRW